MTTKQNRPGGRSQAAPEAFDGAGTIVSDTYANADGWWRDCAWRAVEFLAAGGGDFTAPDHPNRWGALFRAAMTAGLIVPVGFTTSTRRSRHGGILRVWRGLPAGVTR